MKKNFHLTLRKSSFNLKLFSKLSKFNFDDELDENDYIRVTNQKLYSKNGHDIKILTFPHNQIKEDKEMYPKISESIRDNIVLFEWDPCKLISLRRNITAQVMSFKSKVPTSEAFKKNVYSFMSVEEAISSSEELLGFVSSEVKENSEEMTLLAKSIAKRLLSDNDAQFSNINVFSFWLYLILNSHPDNFKPQIGFGGVPQPLFHAKLSQYTEKEQIVLSFIRWTKFLAEKMREGKQQTIEGLFEIKDMVKFQLFLDAKYMRCNYLIEMAKSLMESTEKNVCIVADPLTKKALVKVSKIKELYDSFPVSAYDEKFDKLQNQYSDNMEDVLSQKSFSSFKQENEQKKRMGMPLSEEKNDFFKLSFSEFVKMENLDNASPEEIDNILFKMAFWDVFFETKILESPYVFNKFFFISESRDSLTSERIDEFERKFHVCYKSIQKVKENLISSITKWERPMSIEEAIRSLQTKTKIIFEEIDYYAQEDDSFHEGLVDNLKNYQ